MMRDYENMEHFHEYGLEVAINDFATEVFHNILSFRTLELIFIHKKT